jgi:zinc/manganese transport system permease protein
METDPVLEIVDFLAAPFAACVLLALILGYLGIHVILRRVIFVDLALAQIAALGTLIGFLRGHEAGSAASIGYSFSATLVGAAVFAWTRRRRERVPQEAIIGITFVVASALSILIADRAPEGAEHIKELLAGAVLWVTWPAVLRNLAVFALVAALHYLWRGRFCLISERPDEAFRQGLAVRWWDFLFYATFGVVITLAVAVGGVLLVFAYLVAPAILAVGSADRWSGRLVIALGAGVLASALGLAASYSWDFPSGPAVVCTLGLFLALYAAWKGLVARAAG